VPSPSPSPHSDGNFTERLTSVAVLSARNAWAVGVTGSGRTLILTGN